MAFHISSKNVCGAVEPGTHLQSLQDTAACCSALTMTGQPMFNQQKLTKRAKRQVGFVLQVMCSLLSSAYMVAGSVVPCI